MTLTPHLVAAAGGALAAFVAQVAFAFLLPPAPASDAQPGLAVLLPVAISNLLASGTLAWLAAAMPGPTVTRARWLWTIWGGIQANYFSEVLLFDIGLPRLDALRLLAHGLLVAAAAATVVAWRSPAAAPVRAGAPAIAPAPRLSGLWVAPPLYVVLYLGAGLAVWPLVADYYLARPMPALGPVVALQVVRGLAFGAIVHLIASASIGSRLRAALGAGLALSVLGAVAPLIVPNPYMPEPIRMAHLAEVASSNLAFGAILAWWLQRRRIVAPHRPAVTASS
jgi:hypothetical protein